MHGMVAYSNRPVENKMATRATPIRDTFMLPAELPAVPYMERGKDTDHSINSYIVMIYTPKEKKK